MNKKISLFLAFCIIMGQAYAMKGHKRHINPASLNRNSPTKPHINTLDARGKSPLHRAAIDSDIKKIKYLLQRGARFDLQTQKSSIEAPDFLRNKIGYTVFHIAANKNVQVGHTLKSVLLYYALLQNTPALFEMLSSPDARSRVVAAGILQERALCLKRILEMKNEHGDTAGDIERKRAEFGKTVPCHTPALLLSAHKVNKDLQAFVTACTYKNVALLPDNNIFKVAYDAMPKK